MSHTWTPEEAADLVRQGYSVRQVHRLCGLPYSELCRALGWKVGRERIDLDELFKDALRGLV